MWLLEQNIRQKFEKYESHEANFATDQVEYEASISAASENGPRNLKISKGVASIQVQGVLTKNPSFFAMFFGGGNTTYKEISAALAAADNDDSVKTIDLYVDSPGGTVDGLFDAIGSLQNTKKPIRAVVESLAASAAYAIASQADEIIATSKAAMFGSVGVVASYYKSDNVFDITSTNAPKKRPDPSTEEGQAMIREELDMLHDLFVEAIATGRGTTTKKINSDYGRGGMLTAGEALKRGMIDELQAEQAKPAKASTPPKETATGGDKTREVTKMDLKSLQAQHPDVYQAAVDIGINQERDRVSAHLIAGELSGDLDTALKAAKEGTAMTTALQTSYVMKAANRSDQKVRANEDKAAGEALNGSNKEQGDDDQAKEVLALVRSGMGYEG